MKYFVALLFFVSLSYILLNGFFAVQEVSSEPNGKEVLGEMILGIGIIWVIIFGLFYIGRLIKLKTNT